MQTNGTKDFLSIKKSFKVSDGLNGIILCHTYSSSGYSLALFVFHGGIFERVSGNAYNRAKAYCQSNRTPEFIPKMYSCRPEWPDCTTRETLSVCGALKLRSDFAMRTIAYFCKILKFFCSEDRLIGMNQIPIIQAQDLTEVYSSGKIDVTAILNVNRMVAKGAFAVVVSLVSGICPAIRAARVDSVVAPRHE
jgi:hypothetical protein